MAEEKKNGVVDMNIVVLNGRLTADPQISYTAGDDAYAVAKFSLAVGAVGGKTNFISCVAFRKNAEFIEKYFRKGQKVLVEGSIQTGSYTNKDGQKVYTTDVIVNKQYFGESKKSDAPAADDADGFVAPPPVDDEAIPFN